MAKRIRYKRNEKTGLLESNVLVNDKGFRYQIRIDEDAKDYVIKSFQTEELIKNPKKLTNLNVIKENARQHVIKLGVNLESESRNRSFGVCSKGMTEEKYKELSGGK